MNRTSALCLALLLSCGPQPGPKDTCNAATCDGCCLQGVCHQGVDNNACGRGGYACDVCVTEAGQQCIASACTTVIGGAGGGSGGGHPGTGGGGMQATGGGTSSGGTKHVFVTAAVYAGSFAGQANGQSTADSKCLLAAQSVNLGGSWVAWLASGNSDAWSRINDVGPWYLLDGTTKVFNNKANMTTIPLAAINMTEQGTRLSSGIDYVWTGSNSGGHPSGSDCYEWSDPGFTGTVGSADSLSQWENATSRTCGNSYHLYCIQQ